MNGYGLIVPGLLLTALVLLSIRQGGAARAAQGFSEAAALFLQVLPNLAVGFCLAGFIAVMLPHETVAAWLGAGTGSRGLVLGTLAGALTPGGPFTHFPILASLLAKGAAPGPVAAYITSWALLGVHRVLIWEAPILGWGFVTARLLPSLTCPFLVGWAAQRLIRWLQAQVGA